MIFLGGSQSFIALLASLIVLCVILDKTNFIYNILDEISNRITEEKKKLDQSVSIRRDTALEGMKSDSKYKLLQLYINNLKNNASDKDKVSEQKLHDALEFNLNLSTSFAKLKVGFTDTFMKPTYDLIKNIKRSKEQVIAPFFSLVLCIIAFICDEIISVFPETSDFIVTFLSIFLIFAAIFFVKMWQMFLKSIQINKPQEEKVDTDIKTSQKRKIFYHLHKRWEILFITLPIIYITAIVIGLFIPSIFLKKLLTFGLGLILPLCYIAHLKAETHYQIGNISYESGVKHMTGLLAISLILTIITIGCSTIIPEFKSILLKYNDCIFIKWSVISFILLNGLILPLLMPYWGFKKILNISKREVKNANSLNDNELRKINTSLDEFCQSIKLDE